VKLPGYDHKLYLVVVKEFGMEPMMLLTSWAVGTHRKESVWRIVEYYLVRWKCDESYRYILSSVIIWRISESEAISAFGTLRSWCWQSPIFHRSI